MNDLDRIAAHVRKVAANEGCVRCGVCARTLAGLASVCTQCEAPYHTDCWDYNGGCAVYGCKAAPRDPLRLDLATLKPRPPARRLPAALVAAVSLAAAVYAFRTAPPPKPTLTRATGTFTVRVGAPPPAAGESARELKLATHILVASRAETDFLHLAATPVPRPLDGAAAWPCLFDTARKRGTALTVAAPTLVVQEQRPLHIRVGNSLMFTGNPNATREPNCYELALKPLTVTDTAVKLEVQGKLIEVPFGVSTLVQVAPRADSASAFWARWGLKTAGPDQVLAVIVTPAR